MVGIAAAAMNGPVLPEASLNAPMPQIRGIKSDSTSSFLSMISSVGYTDVSVDVVAAMANFYGKLSAEQEPLEPEFAQVLFDNLWDLYAE